MITPELSITKGEGIENTPDQLVSEQHYAAINREMESLLSSSDKMTLGPSEDFEYKAPLVDFQKTLRKNAQ